MILSSPATSGEGAAAKLASIAQHATNMRLIVLLSLPICFSAVVLGVTLYMITRVQGPALAVLALICRVGEGFAGIFFPQTLGLLWLATSTGANAPDPTAAHAIGAFLLQMDAWSPSAILFAVGSLMFSWLLLRGRMIPAALAWLGVLASLLWVVGLPLQLVGVLPGSITWFIYLPMAAFEIPLGFWLLIKGVAVPTPKVAPSLAA